jgi:anti-sigma B factor antagonist
LELDVNVSHQRGHTVVTVAGEVDAYAAPALEAALAKVAADAHVVVGLTSVEFLDSTGLGVLVSALNRANDNGGSLRLVVTSDRVRRLLELSALTKLFDVCESVDDALDAG